MTPPGAFAFTRDASRLLVVGSLPIGVAVTACLLSLLVTRETLRYANRPPRRSMLRALDLWADCALAIFLAIVTFRFVVMV
jgi:hypothetical protein